LVLYWVWNNILSISQQYIITKRIERDKNAWTEDLTYSFYRHCEELCSEAIQLKNFWS
jgi:membrane protein insertase Oxa1/YidC/SpoIIIJ